LMNNLKRLHRKIKRQNDRSPTCELTTSSDTPDQTNCHNVLLRKPPFTHVYKKQNDSSCVNYT